jgi:hypothetical protein
LLACLETLGCSKHWVPMWAHMGPMWDPYSAQDGPNMGRQWAHNGPEIDPDLAQIWPRWAQHDSSKWAQPGGSLLNKPARYGA